MVTLSAKALNDKIEVAKMNRFAIEPNLSTFDPIFISRHTSEGSITHEHLAQLKKHGLWDRLLAMRDAAEQYHSDEKLRQEYPGASSFSYSFRKTMAILERLSERPNEPFNALPKILSSFEGGFILDFRDEGKFVELPRVEEKCYLQESLIRMLQSFANDQRREPKLRPLPGDTEIAKTAADIIEETIKIMELSPKQIQAAWLDDIELAQGISRTIKNNKTQNVRQIIATVNPVQNMEMAKVNLAYFGKITQIGSLPNFYIDIPLEAPKTVLEEVLEARHQKARDAGKLIVRGK
jgi:hypothetical protein